MDTKKAFILKQAISRYIANFKRKQCLVAGLFM